MRSIYLVLLVMAIVAWKSAFAETITTETTNIYARKTLRDTRAGSAKSVNFDNNWGPGEDSERVNDSTPTHLLYSPEDFHIWDANTPAQLLSSCSTILYSSSLCTVGQGAPIEERIPVVLVHGWQGSPYTRDPLSQLTWDNSAENYWGNLLSFFHDPVYKLDAKYKLFVYKYPSYKHVTFNARMLRELIDEMPELKDKKIVFIAHSMGTIVVRSLFEEHGFPEWRAEKLILLDGVHHGSPAAVPEWAFGNDNIATNTLVKDIRTLGANDIQWDDYDNIFNSTNPTAAINKNINLACFEQITDLPDGPYSPIATYHATSASELSALLNGSPFYKFYDSNFGTRISETAEFDQYYRDLIQEAAPSQSLLPVFRDPAAALAFNQYGTAALPVLPNPWLTWLSLKYQQMPATYKRKLVLYGSINVNSNLFNRNNKVYDQTTFGVAEDVVQNLGGYGYGYLNDGPVPISSQLFDRVYAFDDLVQSSGPSAEVTMYYPWKVAGMNSGTSTVASFAPWMQGVLGSLASGGYEGDGFVKHVLFMDYHHDRMLNGCYKSAPSDLASGISGFSSAADRQAYVARALDGLTVDQTVDPRLSGTTEGLLQLEPLYLSIANQLDPSWATSAFPTAIKGEMEPNDSASLATPINVDGNFTTGKIDRRYDGSHDVDNYSFFLAGPASVAITVRPSVGNGNINDYWTVYLYDESSNNYIYFSVTNRFPAGITRTVGLPAGRYRIKVTTYVSSLYGVAYQVAASATPGNVYEQELNDSAAQARPVTFDTVYTGSIQERSSGNDADYYSFSLDAPANIALNLSPGTGNGNINNTWAVYLFNEANNYLYFTVADTSTAGVTHTVGLPAGKYYVRVFTSNSNLFDVPYKVSVSASAGNIYEQETNDSIAMATPTAFDTVYTGSIQKRSSGNDADYYSFSLAAPANIALNVTPGTGNGNINNTWAVYLFDEANNYLYFTVADTSTAGVTHTVGLPAGKYYVKVFTSNSNLFDVPYKVSVSASAGDIYEQENNDSIALATPTAFDTVYTGSIQKRSSGNDADYYSFSLAAPATIALNVRPGTGNGNINNTWAVYLFDEAHNYLYFTVADTSTAGVTHTVGLPAGKYYVEVYTSNSNLFDAPYKLSVSASVGNTHELERNDSMSQATVLPLNTVYTGNIQKRSSGSDVDYFKFTLLRPDYVTVQGNSKYGMGNINTFWQFSIFDGTGASITSFTFDNYYTSGTAKNLYLPAGDYYIRIGSGNIYFADYEVSASVDHAKPVVATFIVPEISNSRHIGCSMTASDNVAVTDYLITTSTAPPDPAALGWSAIAPTHYLLTDDGEKTLYAWARDAAGNVSDAKTASVTVDTISPVTNPSLSSGTYSGTLQVRLSATEAATIYYTTDGTIPTTSSAVYSAPITVAASMAISYFAVDQAGNREALKIAQYTIAVAGACGPSNGGVSVETPSLLCTTGVPFGVSSASGAWGWNCAGTGGGATAICSAVAATEAAALAVFTSNDGKIVGSAGCETLQSACAVAKSGAAVYASGTEFLEDVVIGAGDGWGTITLKGGFDPSFSKNTGSFTTIDGTLRVRGGRLLAEKVKIR